MPAKTSKNNSPASRHNSKGRIASYEARRRGISREEREDLIPALGLRSYHLPGYSACGDWVQFLCNNHPLFGICCHHRLHPVGFGMRLVHLIGSIVFGLAVTNILWLWFIINEIDEDQAILTVTVNGGMFGNGNSTAGTGLPSLSASVPSGNFSTAVANGDASTTAEDSVAEFSVTQGMFLLWTVGGGLHALFDNTIYYITVCACCLPGQSFEHLQRYQKYGNYLVVWTVVLVAAIASFVVLMRATLENTGTWTLEENENVQQDQQQEQEDTLAFVRTNASSAWDASAYEFLISYAVELTLALLVYYPLLGTILFSGILGCYRLPVLGGRPYEVKQEQRRQSRNNKRKNRRSGSTEYYGASDNV